MTNKAQLTEQLAAITAERDQLVFRNRVLQHEIDLLAKAFAALNRKNNITNPTTNLAAAVTPANLEF